MEKEREKVITVLFDGWSIATIKTLDWWEKLDSNSKQKCLENLRERFLKISIDDLDGNTM